MSNTNFSQRLDRRQRLLALLRSEGYWTTADLREQLEVSQRTLMRELAELKSMGYPIDSDRGRGGGIRLNGHWGIERLHLSHQEVIELVLALSIMERLQSPLLTSHLKAIRQKLFQAFPENQRKSVSGIRKRIFIGDKVNPSADDDPLLKPRQATAKISEAFLKQQLVEIDYESQSGERTSRVIEPHYIVLNWPTWYILSYDHLREADRLFRIDRIRKAQVLEKTFRLKPKPQFHERYEPYFQSI
ncbi:helix-turn-helix transcriptional regulator [Reinekea blandensis]|uniref:Putative transcriptional regulator n=1 Tax=Reinekea blandensis MED297 TaxID=314283 RepID=A4BHT2_9GAMM|nr:WYL domain-containing protein [Reinekea blandensis]EAR08337.1 putative transcriptional regulator [Reinekea sp. MED297] [Reinekea blandensis MED297]